MEPILKVTDLSKAFSRAGRDEFLAVDHVSFEVQPGEILGIVGESGSGKSTIARLITRQIDATGGQIFIDGQDITRLRGRALIPVYAKIQMVFQSPADSFDPRRTLGDGICESLRNKGVAKAEREAKARALLESCGLPGTFLARYPHQVSGGQCQRVAIARAMVGKPDLLLADEPTTALDVTIQAQILALLKRLNREMGMSILFISHNLHVVRKLCTRVAVMEKGRIVETGPVDQIFFHPQAPYTQRLIAAIPTRRKL